MKYIVYFAIGEKKMQMFVEASNPDHAKVIVKKKFKIHDVKEFKVPEDKEVTDLFNKMFGGIFK